MILPQSLREGVIAWKPDGQDWADSLPVLVGHCRELWQLEIGEPFEGGCTALVCVEHKRVHLPMILAN